MKLKLTVGLALLLVAALLVVGVGCKTTGGGWFYDCVHDAKISFGFNAQPVYLDDDDIPDAAKGQFQLIEHGKPQTRIHGTFENVLFSVDEFVTIFEGECTIKGEPYDSAYLLVVLTDLGEGANEFGPGDGIFVMIDPPGPDNTIIYAGFLDGGNIQIHKK